jgi:hypothetical protein
MKLGENLKTDLEKTRPRYTFRKISSVVFIF